MKFTKKLLASVLVFLLFVTGNVVSVGNSFVHAAVDESVAQVGGEAGELHLNHKTRVYNRKGKKKYTYLNGNGLLANDSKIKYVGEVQPLTTQQMLQKHYFFSDNNGNWYYLPYKTIKGKQFYNIGHGGYIKANNVQTVDGCTLYADKIKTTTCVVPYEKDVKIYNVDGTKVVKHMHPGQKITLDRQVNGDINLNLKFDNLSTDAAYYRIDGTDTFIYRYDVKALRHYLLPYTNYTDVVVVRDTDTCDKYGKNIQMIDGSRHDHSMINEKEYKGNILVVSNANELFIEADGKKELVYQDGNYDNRFVKAADVKYVYGKPLETLK